PLSAALAAEAPASDSTSHSTETLETSETPGTSETLETQHPAQPGSDVSNVSTEYLDPAEVREYAERHGCTGEIEGALWAMWAMRLEIEKGLRPAAEVNAARLPDDLPGFVCLYWQGFIRLLECRWSYGMYAG